MSEEYNDCPHDHVTDDYCDDCGALLDEDDGNEEYEEDQDYE